MAADTSKLEDCLAFLAQTLKAYKDPLNDEIVESVNVAIRTNHVTGAVLFRFTDEEWKELVQSVCLRVHIRDALKKVIQADEKTAVFQLHRKGLSKKPITELTPKATTLWSSRGRRPSRSTVKRHPATCQPPTCGRGASGARAGRQRGAMSSWAR
jgi:hypothetical protein